MSDLPQPWVPWWFLRDINHPALRIMGDRERLIWLMTYGWAATASPVHGELLGLDGQPLEPAELRTVTGLKCEPSEIEHAWDTFAEAGLMTRAQDRWVCPTPTALSNRGRQQLFRLRQGHAGSATREDLIRVASLERAGDVTDMDARTRNASVTEASSDGNGGVTPEHNAGVGPDDARVNAGVTAQPRNAGVEPRNAGARPLPEHNAGVGPDDAWVNAGVGPDDAGVNAGVTDTGGLSAAECNAGVTKRNAGVDTPARASPARASRPRTGPKHGGGGEIKKEKSGEDAPPAKNAGGASGAPTRERAGERAAQIGQVFDGISKAWGSRVHRAGRAVKVVEGLLATGFIADEIVEAWQRGQAEKHAQGKGEFYRLQWLEEDIETMVRRHVNGRNASVTGDGDVTRQTREMLERYRGQRRA